MSATSPSPSRLPAVRARLRRPPAVLRSGAAIAGVAVALAMSLALRGFIATNVFIFFFAAGIVAAWYGGRGPALLATALTVPLVNYFFLTPHSSWSASPAAISRLAVFALLSLLVGSMRESLDRARLAAEDSEAQARQHAEEVESQAAELQEQAAELEQQIDEATRLQRELEDANRRIEAQARSTLAEAQALAHVGSWEWSIADDRVSWSDEMYRIYGYAPGALEVRLDTVLEHVHPDDRERAGAEVRRSLETGEPLRSRGPGS